MSKSNHKKRRLKFVMDFFARKRYQKKKLKKQHFAKELTREKICLEETLIFLKEKERR